MSGRLLSTDSFASQMEVNDQARLEELLVAFTVLKSEELAMEVVAEVVHELPYSAARLAESRTPRYGAELEGHPSRPLMGTRELLRLLLLQKLNELGIKEERAGRLQTRQAQLGCYAQQIVLAVLSRNSFHAAVAMTQVLCKYRARQTWEMYREVAPSRARTKEAPSCTTAKQEILQDIVARFEDRVQWSTDGPAHGLKSHRAAPAEADAMRHWLTLFLPPLCPPPTPVEDSVFQKRHFPRFRESHTETARVRRFLDPVQFDKLAAQILGGDPTGSFEKHLLIPDIALPCPTDPDSDWDDADVTVPHFDLERLRDMIESRRNRRNKWNARRVLESGSFSIRIDGIDRGIIDSMNPCCSLLLEAGARVVKLVDVADDGEPVTLAVYALTYDAPKTEFCELEIRGMGLACFRFEYRSDETVAASIDIRPSLMEKPETICIREDESNDKIEEESPAMMLEQTTVQGLPKDHMANNAELIDVLVARQSNVVDQFLAQAKAHGLSLNPIPSIYEPHARLRRTFGMLATLTGICEGTVLLLMRNLLDTLGAPITSLSIAFVSLLVILAVKLWWSFGWSQRLSRKYDEAGHSIELLQAHLNSKGSETNQLMTYRAVADWRGLPFARTLSWLLCSRASHDQTDSQYGLDGQWRSSDPTSWMVNSVTAKELVEIIMELGEGKKARQLASAIVSGRPFVSSIHLAELLRTSLGLPDAATKVLEESMNGVQRSTSSGVRGGDGDNSV